MTADLALSIILWIYIGCTFGWCIYLTVNAYLSEQPRKRPDPVPIDDNLTPWFIRDMQEQVETDRVAAFGTTPTPTNGYETITMGGTALHARLIAEWRYG